MIPLITFLASFADFDQIYDLDIHGAWNKIMTCKQVEVDRSDGKCYLK